MTIDRTYRCDLCNDLHTAHELFGIYWKCDERPAQWVLVEPKGVEHHLCAKCISTIQNFKAICGQGFECTGGRRCSSDHK